MLIFLPDLIRTQRIIRELSVRHAYTSVYAITVNYMGDSFMFSIEDDPDIFENVKQMLRPYRRNPVISSSLSESDWWEVINMEQSWQEVLEIIYYFSQQGEPNYFTANVFIVPDRLIFRDGRLRNREFTFEGQRVIMLINNGTSVSEFRNVPDMSAVLNLLP